MLTYNDAQIRCTSVYLTTTTADLQIRLYPVFNSPESIIPHLYTLTVLGKVPQWGGPKIGNKSHLTTTLVVGHVRQYKEHNVILVSDYSESSLMLTYVKNRFGDLGGLGEVNGCMTFVGDKP